MNKNEQIVMNSIPDTGKEEPEGAGLDQRLEVLGNWVDDKINQSDVGEPVKRSLIKHFNWLRLKCRECEDPTTAEMLNQQLCDLLDYVDTISPKEEQSAENGEKKDYDTSRGADQKTKPEGPLSEDNTSADHSSTTEDTVSTDKNSFPGDKDVSADNGNAKPEAPSTGDNKPAATFNQQGPRMPADSDKTKRKDDGRSGIMDRSLSDPGVPTNDAVTKGAHPGDGAKSESVDSDAPTESLQQTKQVSYDEEPPDTWLCSQPRRKKEPSKHLNARDWMEEPSFVPRSEWQDEDGWYEARRRERSLARQNNRLTERNRDQGRPHHNYGRDQLLKLQPGDKSDIILNIPNVSVDLIEFEVNNISARVALDAGVGNEMVRLFVGVDVKIERVKLTIEAVQATAQLIVRLDNVRKIVERGLEVLDSNKHPSILGMVGRLTGTDSPK